MEQQQSWVRERMRRTKCTGRKSADKFRVRRNLVGKLYHVSLSLRSIDWNNRSRKSHNWRFACLWFWVTRYAVNSQFRLIIRKNVGHDTLPYSRRSNFAAALPTNATVAFLLAFSLKTRSSKPTWLRIFRLRVGDVSVTVWPVVNWSCFGSSGHLIKNDCLNTVYRARNWKLDYSTY